MIAWSNKKTKLYNFIYFNYILLLKKETKESLISTYYKTIKLEMDFNLVFRSSNDLILELHLKDE